MKFQPTINIDYFTDLGIFYKVINLEIQEEFSEVTKINFKIFFFDSNIWHINIPLKTEIIIRITEHDNMFQTYEKIYKCFVKETKKEKFNNNESILFQEYYLEIFCLHSLGKLHYSNNFYLWKHKTVGDVIRDVLLKHNLSLEGNVYNLYKFEKELIVQYGENDLHFVERLLQDSGFFYVCVKDSNEIKVYDTNIGYEEINSQVDIYNINKIFLCEMNTISYINECNSLEHEEFIHRDFNHMLPLQLESLKIEDNISYGQLYTYPSNSNNLQEINRSSINKKNQFYKQKYEGLSYCSKFEIGKRIIIEDIKNEHPHVITYVKHFFSSDTPSNNFGTNYNYYNLFKTKDSNETFVTNKILKKPLISSMEVGIVKAEIEGEEISLNNYEKVLIQFNWTKDNILFYVWVPVAQYMAGKIFGSFIMPRVGDEVLIYFINGDPDKPIVYGALHTQKTPKFINELEDKYKTVLLRSQTFNEESILSYNEISIDDKYHEQKLYFQAQKNLEIKIGHENQELEHYYSTKILGKGYKKEFIQEGDNTLEMLKGSKIQSIGGNIKTQVVRTEKGGDVFFTIEDGKLIIKVNGLTDVNITGPTKIKVDDLLDIKAVGPIKIHSDEKILMTAPEITMIADMKISYEAGMMISSKAGEVIYSEAGEVMTMKSGIAINIESNIKLIIKAGFMISVVSGLELTLEGELRTSINGGLELTAEGGCSTGFMSGLATNINGGLEASIKGGLTTELMSGLDTSVEGLNTEITAGLAASVLGAAASSVAGGGLVAMMI